MSKDTKIEVDGREIELSSLDKMYFPDDGITKGDVIDYYREIADVMLPHLADRPISMKRYPDGIDGKSFFQKRTPDYFPDWIQTTKVEIESGEKIEQVVVSDAPTLVYLANQGCLTPHIWLSRTDKIRKPDRMIFDLDPSGDATFDDVVFAACRIRDALEERDLRSWVMTTGSKGLHVLVGLERRHDFDAVRSWTSDLADELVEEHPDRLTTKKRKNQRGDRVFLDYLRNAYAQTTVAPYAIRARPEAPVAAPVEWDELSGDRFGPRRWTIKNIFRRLSQRDDPWADFGRGARLPVS